MSDNKKSKTFKIDGNNNIKKADWLCKCGYHNFWDKWNCRRCGASSINNKKSKKKLNNL